MRLPPDSLDVIGDELARRAPGVPTPASDAMGARFVGLWRRSQGGADDGRATSLWRDVRSQYAEPHRHYHNADHLAHCLRQFDLVAEHLTRPDEVETAIWFHDVILVPGRRDNEERSAEYFRSMAAGLSPGFVDRVVDLILSTTHRSSPADLDHQSLCDIDLSSFGSPWERFLENSTAIEAEFPGTRAEYVRGETAFLLALLDRRRIFLTDFFRDRYEQGARENIRRFLRRLDEPATP